MVENNSIDNLDRQDLLMVLDGFIEQTRQIYGDYAELRRVDALAQDREENKVMARALLPADIMEGNKILYENLQYRLITE